MTGNGRDQKPNQRLRPVMSTDDIDTLFMMILNDRAVRSEACRLMSVTHFHKDGEAHYTVLFRAIKTLHDASPELDKLPYMELERIVREAFDQAYVNEELRDELLSVPDMNAPKGERGTPGLLFWAYRKVKKTDFTTEGGYTELKRFVNERAIHNEFRKLAGTSPSRVLDGWREAVEGLYKVMQATEAITDSPFVSLRLDDDDTPGIDFRSTGLEFLDLMLDGGMAPNEIYGILAGTGRGKSTLIRFLAVRAFEMELARHLRYGGPQPRASIIVNYEDQYKSDLWPGIIACAARIKKKHLLQAKNFKRDLSHTGNLLDYEKATAIAEGENPDTYPGEYERYHQAVERYNNKILILDMLKEGRGMGGVAEVATLIERSCGKARIDPGMALIDSIDILCSNELIARGERDVQKALISHIPTTVSVMRRNIAMHFGIPVWTTNQLGAESLKRGAGYKPSHTDASGARMFGKALVACFTLSSPFEDGEDIIVQFNCSKFRRSRQPESCFLKLDGDFSRFLDASADYFLSGTQILNKAHQDIIKGPPAARVAKRTSVSMTNDVE